MLALAAGSGLGCAVEDDNGGGTAEEEGGASTDDIVNGDTEAAQTRVKRQSIGNCWLYATASWVEAMHLRATGEQLNVSESYLTYWHWYEQIANSSGTSISTGGSYSVAVNLIERYGIMKEGDFLPNEAELEMSSAQARAETYINNSLKSGKLATRQARQDRELVRAELNQAFGVSKERAERMNRVFGRAVTRTIDLSYASRRPGYEVLRAKDITVAVPNAETHQLENVTLLDAIGTGSRWSRSGKYAHQEISLPYNESGYREFQKRFQRALHDGAVPVISWMVDFNALDSESRFSLEELERNGPGINGRQGGHMVAAHDYQAILADGTVLKAGEDATPEQLEQALADDTSIEFIRVKNSWGAARPDRWQSSAIAGYHDLDWTYLTARLKSCPESATSASECYDSYQPALWDIVLPAGY